MKLTVKPQCAAIVQPGEYIIDVWDNKRCILKYPLVYCETCRKYFCSMKHWGMHNECTGEGK